MTRSIRGETLVSLALGESSAMLMACTVSGKPDGNATAALASGGARG